MRLVGHFSYGAETPSKQDRLSGRKDWHRTVAKAGTLIIDGLPGAPDLSSWILNFMPGGGSPVELQIGLSKVHPKDDFSRKEGLRVAQANMKTVQATIDSILVLKTLIRVEFQTEEGTFWVRYPAGGRRPQLDGQTFINCSY